MKKLIALLLSLMMVLAATAALADGLTFTTRSEEHTSELQSR